MSRKITIHSDGTGHGTVLIDEDGNKLSNVNEISFRIEANGVSEAEITVNHININSIGEIQVVMFQCPLCYETHHHTCDTTFNQEHLPPAQMQVVIDNSGKAKLAPVSVCKKQPSSWNGDRPPDCVLNVGHTTKHFNGEDVFI